jgi:MYXO-CTERM domain-containing protein
MTDRRASAPLVPLLLVLVFLAVLALIGLHVDAQVMLSGVRFRNAGDLSITVGADAGLQALTLADVNRDGRLDLVVVNRPQDTVSVLLGQGDARFEDPRVFPTGESPTAVAVADVASPGGGPDGNPDLIVVDELGGITLWLGRGDGEFDESEQDFGAIEWADEEPFELIGVAVGNFDRDSAPDLALLDAFDLVFFLCNDQGTFSPCRQEFAETGAEPIKILPGNFDSDANLDLAVLNQGDRNLSIFLGNGDGSFSASRDGPSSSVGDQDPQDFAVARLDGDQLDDIAVVNFEDFDIFGLVLLFSIDGGRFDRDDRNTVLESSTAIAVANFNGDPGNRSDIFLSSAANRTALYVGDGQGGFATPDPFTLILPRSILLATGDIGGDGLPDIVALLANGQQIRLAVNATNEDTPTPGTPSPGTPPTGPPGTPTPTVPTSTPTASPTPTAIPTAPYSRCDVRLGGAGGQYTGIAAGRFDGNGSTDLAVSDRAAGGVRLWLNTSDALNTVRNCAMALNGTPITIEAPIVAPVSGAGALAALEIGTPNGIVDLAVTAAEGVVLLDGNGSGGFTRRSVLALPTGGEATIVTDSPSDPLNPLIRSPLDLDGNGITDIVVANGSRFLSIFYGQANGTFQSFQQELRREATSVAAADFDFDGDIDLVAGTGTEVEVLINEGGANNATRFVARGRSAEGSPIGVLATGFFDEDQRPDLVLARGGLGATDDTAEVRRFDSGSFEFSLSGSFPVDGRPRAAGIGFFDAVDTNFDIVVASDETSTLSFGLGDGQGGFRLTPVPFAVGSGPVALVVANLDQDRFEDVATANTGGTVSILLSSVPPPTATPAPTGTPTQTLSPSMTGTVTATPSPTPTAVGTRTDTPTRTLTPTVTPTSTPTKAGIFELSGGGGCSVAPAEPGVPPIWLALSALLVAAAWRRRTTRPRRRKKVE